MIGIIYESRPNVTADAFGLCFKAGNAVILKGGSDAIRSNIAIGKVLREALTASGVTEDIIQVVEDVSRETTAKLMRLNEYVDVLIPRGGAGLIKAVKENSTRRSMETNSPTGSFKPATWRSPSAIADTRAFVRESLSIIISFTPFSRAEKTSMALRGRLLRPLSVSA